MNATVCEIWLPRNETETWLEFVDALLSKQNEAKEEWSQREVRRGSVTVNLERWISMRPLTLIIQARRVSFTSASITKKAFWFESVWASSSQWSEQNRAQRSWKRSRVQASKSNPSAIQAFCSSPKQTIAVVDRPEIKKRQTIRLQKSWIESFSVLLIENYSSTNWQPTYIHYSDEIKKVGKGEERTKFSGYSNSDEWCVINMKLKRSLFSEENGRERKRFVRPEEVEREEFYWLLE